MSSESLAMKISPETLREAIRQDPSILEKPLKDVLGFYLVFQPRRYGNGYKTIKSVMFEDEFKQKFFFPFGAGKCYMSPIVKKLNKRLK